MSQDLYHHTHEQLSQAIQEQALLAQEDSTRALHDFVPTTIGEIDSFYCDDTEHHIHYLDGIIPVYVPYDEEEDEDIESDEHVIAAIIEREECELLDEIEGDKQAIDYFSSEHIDEFGEKAQKRLEEMRRNYSEH